MKTMFLSAALAVAASAGVAAPEKYVLDASHSQILFSYDHLGFSTSWGMFSGFEGEIMFDKDDPANSSVTVSFPVRSMFTGWEKRFDHFMSDDFFGAGADDMITFTSTSIDVNDDDEARITGDLTMNGVTRPVVLEAELNKMGQHPMAGKDWAGFEAETTLKRSDFNLGKFAPAVGDEVEVEISIEAMRAD